jgi:ATP-dependent helicase HrpB
MTIHYDGEQPYVMVKIQEVFGLKATPKLANGRIPILLHLLSPAQRPVQVTADLASFWSNGYAIVRKDLRGRYPKHYWPEDPTQAVASKRTLKPKT